MVVLRNGDAETMSHKIIGKVIRILDPTTIVVETNEPDLVIDDSVEIFTLADELKGSNGESLGRIPIIKEKLQIKQVEDGFILCSRTIERKAFLAISPLLDTKITEEVNLNVNRDDIEPLSEKPVDTIVRGDLVRLA